MGKLKDLNPKIGSYYSIFQSIPKGLFFMLTTKGRDDDVAMLISAPSTSEHTWMK